MNRNYLLTRETILAALERMGQIALASGVALEVCIYGGTVMMLAYGCRNATRDVDATVSPRVEGKAIAEKVGAEMGLPENWFNDEVRIFLSHSESLIPLTLKSGDVPLVGIRIHRPSASYLLAMKCRACRTPLPGYRGDFDDLTFLIRKMNIRNVSQAEEHVERHFPRYELDDVKQKIITGLIKEVWG